MTTRILLLFLALLCAFPVFGQSDDDSRGSYLTVKIAVVGPGDEIYLWWGHIGIIIEDALSGENRFYDWGVFSFDNNNFYLNFALGRLLYACTMTPAEYNIERNIRTNRAITTYTLNLSSQKKAELQRFAGNNVLPENANYWYHHFDDNCATRVRDVIDMASSGAFKARYGEAPGRFTLREHVRRHTWFSPFWDWAVSFWMGRGIDQPITMWQEMFLPSEIGRNIQNFTYTDENGVLRNLVSAVEVINTAQNRPAPLESSPFSFREALAGILAAVFLAGAFAGGGIVTKKRARLVLGLGQSVLGLYFGIAGSLLFFLEFFTNHDYTWHNTNIIYINPLVLAAFPLGLIFAFTKNGARFARAQKVLRALWIYVSSAGLFTLVLNVFPPLYQHNWETFALVFPPAFVLGFVPFFYNPGFSGDFFTGLPGKPKKAAR
ncbi:MAG: DUF4105 domain-containing protein [Treponema sp.]|jgi:hypothetical protein|nr:DUF4105 domain-containing protein [Treponema sp.]